MKTILIITNAKDGTADIVIKHLKEIGENFVRFNTETFPLSNTLTISCVKSDSTYIQLNGENYSPASFKSVWYRRPEKPDFAGSALERQHKEFIEKESSAFLWSFYTLLSQSFWVNPPLYGHRLLEHNKLFQMRDAASVGLYVPDSIVTNSFDNLLHFCEDHENVMAIKTLGQHFIVDEKNPEETYLIYTNRVERDFLIQHQNDIAVAPVFAQEYVPKKIELRITVVGDMFFTCAIDSQASKLTQHDWRRYDFDHVKHKSYELPEEVKQKLRFLMQRWHLNFGAIDMILTPDGKYVFLEINPSGQWIWIERLTGMPISQTVAKLLARS